MVAVAVGVRVDVADGGEDAVARPLVALGDLGAEVVREELDAGHRPVPLDVPAVDLVVPVDRALDRRGVRPVPELARAEEPLAAAGVDDVADGVSQRDAGVRVVLLRGDGGLPRAEVAVTVDSGAAELAERLRVRQVHRVVGVGAPLAVRVPADEDSRDVAGAVLPVSEQVPLGAVLVRRDELVTVRVRRRGPVLRPREVGLGDVGAVGCLRDAEQLVAAADGLAALDEDLVLAGRGPDLPLFRLSVGDADLGEVVVVAVELEGEAAEVADGRSAERLRVPFFGVLEAVQ